MRPEVKALQVNLKTEIKRKNHTQKTLSDGVMIPLGSIFRYCNGAPIPIDRAYAIAEFLGTDVKKIWVYRKDDYYASRKKTSAENRAVKVSDEEIDKKLKDIFG